MSIRTAAAITMIMLTAGLCFWLFIRPIIMPPQETLRFVDEKQLLYVGHSEEGGRTFAYASIKDEIKEWSGVLAPFAPIISLLIAFLLKEKKRGGRS